MTPLVKLSCPYCGARKMTLSHDYRIVAYHPPDDCCLPRALEVLSMLEQDPEAAGEDVARLEKAAKKFLSAGGDLAAAREAIKNNRPKAIEFVLDDAMPGEK